MIPLIIINYNKLACLKRSLESYKKLKDVDIHIIDNGSNFLALEMFYNSLTNITVHYRDKISSADELPVNVNDVLNTIKQEYDYDYYIVTDSDIEIENPEKLVTVFKYLHMRYPTEMVSPMLRIDDLPKNKYTDEQIKFHIEQFYDKPRVRIDTPIGVVLGIESIVDTTFAMYKSTFEYRRFAIGYRLFEPFMAKHLDWYDDLGELSEEKRHYLRHSNPKISTATKHIKDHYPNIAK